MLNSPDARVLLVCNPNTWLFSSRTGAGERSAAAASEGGAIDAIHGRVIT
jgi:hypothetical protein